MTFKTKNVVVPIVKWAGGKRQLLIALRARLPKKWNTYYEPFVGGGALLTDLFNHGQLSHAIISDLNKELINLYIVIKTSPSELIDELQDEKFENNESAFNALKSEFNQIINQRKNEIRRAALFIYLNKHGYNGLWRVNSAGEYNVPFGSRVRGNLPSHDAICQFSRMLADVEIQSNDFSIAVQSAQKGDFVYFDPPYYPLSKTASFTAYHQNGFGFKEQERLAQTFKRLSDRGVHVMLSNSKAPEIELLYKDYSIASIPAKRLINCNGDGRYGTFEIIVANYGTSELI
jgi:DNA adenine methylase